MTVASEVSRINYNGDGVSQAFPVPFYFLVNSDLVVLLVSPAGISVTQVLAADYTVAGAGVLAGGTVNMTVAPPAGYTLIIYRDPAATQLTDYQANDPFPAETHERALDKLTMLVQRLRSLASRSLTLSDSDSSNASTQLPKFVAGKLLGISADGLSIVATDPSAVGAGSITSIELADNAVTTNKIVNLAVTFGKLIANLFTGAAIVAPVAGDYVVISDISDAGNTKRTLLSDIIALVTTNIPAATTAVSGILKTSTIALVQTGTDILTAITPAALLGALGFSKTYISTQQTITTGGNLVLAHGLGRQPVLYQAFLKCITSGDGAYVAGQEIAINPNINSNGTPSSGLSMIPDATNITVQFGNDANVFRVVDRISSALVLLTNARWQLIIRAWG